MRLLLPLLCVNLFALCGTATAQKYQLKEADAIYDDYLHAIYPTGPDRFVVINYASPHGAFKATRQNVFTAIAYDDRLKKLYEKNVEEFAGKEYVEGITSGSRLFLFAKDNAGAVYKTEFNPATGASAGKAEKLFSVTGNIYSFMKGVSADSNYFYLVYEGHETGAKSEGYKGVVMDRNMNVVTTFSFSTAEKPSNIISTELLLSGNGTLSVIQALKGEAKKNALPSLQYVLRQVGKDGKPILTLLSGLPEGHLNAMTWQAAKEELVFTGFLAKAKKSGFTSMVSGSFDPAQRKLTRIKETALASVPCVQHATEFYIKDLATEGLPIDSKLLSVYRNPDGSSYLILEANSSSYYDAYGQWMANGGAFGTSSRYGSSTDYTAGNVYVLRLNTANEIEWLKVIGKKQIQADSNKYVSVAHIKDGNDGLHLLFHDEPDHKSVEPRKRMEYTALEKSMKNTALASVYISKDGSITKSFLKDNAGSDHHLSPVNFVQVGGKQILYTSYELRNAGKSTYRLGTVILP